MNSLFERMSSRKFLMSAFGAVLILASSLEIIPLDDDSAWQLISILMGYVGIEGATDLVGAWRRGRIPLE